MATKRPNVLIILADDLGYSDIGCFGGEIRTPNIDRLAQEGLRFSDYHTSPLCSPTRAMLMSGTDCHLAGLGVMNENSSRQPEFRGRPGFEGYMNRDVVTIPELLQEGGYMTLMSGKWHLGYKRGHIPCDRGFDRSFSMLCGAQNHFGWSPDWRKQGLTKPSPAMGGNDPIYVYEDKRWLPTPNTTMDPNGYYSSNHFADTLIDFFKDSASTRTTNDQPFFAYLPFSAPHTPIQCFTSDREHYTGMYDDGPNKLREKRLAKMAELGLIDPDVTPHQINATSKDWDQMSEQERKISAREYECYSGLVEAMDRAIGRVIDYLRSTDELENTLVLFFSDNGPASLTANGEQGAGSKSDGAADLRAELEDLLGQNVEEKIKEYFDNSLENLGAHNSFPKPGARWASASTAPHRLYKGMTTEGGIRVPMVLRYPPFLQHHKPGGISHAFTTVMDIMPTLLTLGDVTHPNAHPATPTTKVAWKDRKVYPMRGRDWTPYLLGGKKADSSTIAKDLQDETKQLVGRRKLFILPGEDEAIWGAESEAVGWEMHSRAAVRKGKWKIVNLPSDRWGTDHWQLYNLEVDQGEVNDLAKEQPGKLKEMLEYWDKYQKETGAYIRRERDDLPPEIKPKDLQGPARPGQDAWRSVELGETLQEGALTEY